MPIAYSLIFEEEILNSKFTPLYIRREERNNMMRTFFDYGRVY
jgi:hypothetical protein